MGTSQSNQVKIRLIVILDLLSDKIGQRISSWLPLAQKIRLTYLRGENEKQEAGGLSSPVDLFCGGSFTEPPRTTKLSTFSRVDYLWVPVFLLVLFLDYCMICKTVFQ